MVIDHGAKPDIANGSWEPWARTWRASPAIRRALQGLGPRHRGAGGLEDRRASPVRRLLLATFGPQRLMWGSDWPVVTLASNYRRWHDAAATLLPADTHAAIFGGTATGFYGL